MTATITMTWHEKKGEVEMRTTFNIELKVDITTADEERLKVFIDLVTNSARMMYGQAAMIAKRAPTLKVTSIGADGKTNHNVFAGDEFDSGE
jgi:P2-related tail formation protein